MRFFLLWSAWNCFVCGIEPHCITHDYDYAQNCLVVVQLTINDTPNHWTTEPNSHLLEEEKNCATVLLLFTSIQFMCIACSPACLPACQPDEATLTPYTGALRSYISWYYFNVYRMWASSLTSFMNKLFIIFDCTLCTAFDSFGSNLSLPIKT